VNSIDEFDVAILKRSQLPVFTRTMDLVTLHSSQDKHDPNFIA
jgi:hypothetical protein